MNKRFLIVCWLAGCIVVNAVGAGGRLAAATGTATIVVTTTTDTQDFAGAQQVADLPGPDGLVTLREAVIAANNTPGPDTIAFNIPLDDSNFNGGSFWIILDYGDQLMVTDDATTIDGSTQTAATGDTAAGPEIILFGSPVVANNTGLVIKSHHNLLRGLGGFQQFRYGIDLQGNNNRVVGSSTAQSYSAGIHITGSGNTIGGLTAAEGNRISSSGTGVWMRSTASNNLVIGNRISGNHSSGVSIEGGSYNRVGGLAPAERNVIGSNGHLSSGRTPVGSDISVGGSYNTIQGNYIGLDETGTVAAGGLTSSGISVAGQFQTIGGSAPGAGNVIAGHSWKSYARTARPAAIRVGGGSQTHDVVIQGNLIGTDATGTRPLPNRQGIVIDDWSFDQAPSNIQIGGSAPGAGNVIAYNVEFGIAVRGTGPVYPTGVTISRNSIFENEDPTTALTEALELGIDLGDNGLTANDPGDGDAGPNQLHNAPIITDASPIGEHTVVAGTIDAPNPATVIVELYSNQAPDPGGQGEGQRFEGSVQASPDGTFQLSLPRNLSGLSLTATATDAQGNTSEFSPARTVGSSKLTEFVFLPLVVAP